MRTRSGFRVAAFADGHADPGQNVFGDILRHMGGFAQRARYHVGDWRSLAARYASPPRYAVGERHSAGCDGA